MNEGNHANMHRDHQYWLADCAMWRDDINLWKDECGNALADLEQVEAALRWLAESIDNHEAGIDRHVDKMAVTSIQSATSREQGRAARWTCSRSPRRISRRVSTTPGSSRLMNDSERASYTMAHWHTLLTE